MAHLISCNFMYLIKFGAHGISTFETKMKDTPSPEMFEAKCALLLMSGTRDVYQNRACL